jgi:cyclopropane fatty-acyl-phospholipid synthase-like methyltransferase
MTSAQQNQRPKITVATNLLSDRPQLWANLGLWSAGNLLTYEAACQSLAQLHGDTGRLEAPHKLLDVAAGRGASLTFWHTHYGLRDIDALEPDRFSCDLIQKNSQESQTPWLGQVYNDTLESYLDNNQKSPFPWGQYDRVLCIDSAYHMRSTEDFLRFGHLALKPGGLLVWTNFTHTQPLPTLPAKLLKWVGIHQESIINTTRFSKQSTDHGFSIDTVLNINEHVMGGFSMFVKSRRRLLPWHSRLLKSWWTIEGTALALDGLAANKDMGYGLYVLKKKVTPVLGRRHDL